MRAKWASDGATFGLTSLAAFLTIVSLAQAQQPGRAAPAAPPSQYVQCPVRGQPLIRIPELVSQGGKLRGIIQLSNVTDRMFLGGKDPVNQCVPQDVRRLTGVNAALPDYPGQIPAGYPGAVPVPPSSQYGDLMPGPTLRAHVGDIIELTFLNQIGTGPYWNSVDRGEKGQGCDQFSTLNAQGQRVPHYPGIDQFPDCFHGSSTGNIHFHGTHTNPTTTGDDVFVQIRPSPFKDGKPVVTEATERPLLEPFFSNCEANLNKSVLSQWPYVWADLPPKWTARQEELLKAYDSDPVIKEKLWPVDAEQKAIGAWPEFYIGAFPYCFRLPEYRTPAKGLLARPPNHGSTPYNPLALQRLRALQMGQAPGTHWYHAHKHGSTTIDVENGMAGAFIIEGGYDDALNSFYNATPTQNPPWARTQPVLVIEQFGTGTNLAGGGTKGGGPMPFSVNGRFNPVITMQPDQVQLWRIVNAASRGGVFIGGFSPVSETKPSDPQTFVWKQTAQDGVQFNGANYEASKDPHLFLASGNRGDLLIQAPAKEGTYTLWASQVRSRCETLAQSQIPTIPVPNPNAKPPTTTTPICTSQPLTALLTVKVAGTPATGNQAAFVPEKTMQDAFPAFLKDVAAEDVLSTKTVVFESKPAPNGGFPAVHTIDGEQFDGNVGAVVLLNAMEEWKVVNKTVNGGIDPTTNAIIATDPPAVVDHPFHIHINPFQVVEFFDPNEVLPGTATPKYIFSGAPAAGQCLLDLKNPESWKPCDNPPNTNGRIWWDVFSIPSARAVFGKAPDGSNTITVVPGYFKMRSNFVDYTGTYVIHCHILAHEDRGMMTVVEVVPFTTPYSHH